MGGVVLGDHIGIGIGVGVNIIDRATHAYVGSADPTTSGRDPSVRVDGATAISAENHGRLVVFVLGGAIQGVSIGDDGGPRPQPAPTINFGNQWTVGVGISVAVNVITDNAEAWIDSFALVGGGIIRHRDPGHVAARDRGGRRVRGCDAQPADDEHPGFVDQRRDRRRGRGRPAHPDDACARP